MIRRTLIGVSVLMPLLTLPWGIAYWSLGERLAGAIPGGYSILTVLSLVVLRLWGGWEWFRVSQVASFLLLPFLLMWTLGGFGPSSAVLVWALMAPLASLWAHRYREGLGVTVAMVGLIVFSGLIDSSLPETNTLPAWAITLFYVANFFAMTWVVFLVTAFFVYEHRASVEVLRRNRELESAYLEQEISLRQSERLATVGRLSAGLAHELNNPAAAAQQATGDLSKALLGSARVDEDIDRLGLTSQQSAWLKTYAKRIQDRVERPEFLDPVERSDRESEIQDLLEAIGFDEAWSLAPALVGLGLDRSDLAQLTDGLDPEHRAEAIELLTRQFQNQGLLSSLDESTGRIIAMVKALKSYTHLDQAPRQPVDLHEGLDSTLIVLRNRLKSGIEVVRDYDPSIPAIDAYPGELNQVWTNVLDNAADAMSERGVIVLRTRRDGDHVIVELEDNGPGVSPDVINNVFDPFVTTKAPGEGTGLGLNISHRIVTDRHHGHVSVASEAGRTVFTIRLPISAPTAKSGRAEDTRSDRAEHHTRRRT